MSVPYGPQNPSSRGSTPKEGDVIAGTYVVEKVIGRGGMGVVVSAQHLTQGYHVALKLLLPQSFEVPGALERFLREARLASAIQSEHVARVLELGTLESGMPFLVMELLHGEHFGQLLRSRGPLPIQIAVDYLLQACEAVAEAHARGIVHRDLKPSNIFLTARADGSPLVKVLDFGLSKPMTSDLMSSKDGSLTLTEMVLGSPHYMSPEQMRKSKTIDERTDIWSLGVILYQLLTGRRPFNADGIGATLMAVASEQPTPPRAHRPDIPPGLEAVILRCVEKNVDERIQSVTELAQALTPYGSQSAQWSAKQITHTQSGMKPQRRPTLSSHADFGRPPQASLPALPNSTDDGSVSTAGVAGPSAPRSRSSLWMMIALAILTPTALGIGVLLWHELSGSKPAASTVASEAVETSAAPTQPQAPSAAEAAQEEPPAPTADAEPTDDDGGAVLATSESAPIPSAPKAPKPTAPSTSASTAPENPLDRWE